VKKYGTLRLLPANKEVVVRSIQIQDEDYEQADAGTRVGLAVRGATVDGMARGSVLTSLLSVKADTELNIKFKKSAFYTDEIKLGAFHATVGMQTVPITITEKSEESISLQPAKAIVREPDQPMVLLDLNAKKARVMGKGTA
jgi:selenocysteine-specific translation elongation factor